MTKELCGLSLVSMYLLSALSQEPSLPPRTHVSKVPVRVGLCPGPLCPLPWPGKAYPLWVLWTQLTRQLGSSGYNWVDPQLSRLIPLL